MEMSKERLAAFADAVLAVIITILVLELGKPAHLTVQGFLELWPNYLAYAISFFWLGAMLYSVLITLLFLVIPNQIKRIQHE